MTDSSSPNGSSSQLAPTAPIHVAIIMDGNGRWANTRGKVRSDGHRAGTQNIRRIIKAFANRGVQYLTLYAFSTENWERPGEEVDALMELLGEAIRTETRALHKEGVRIRHLGRTRPTLLCEPQQHNDRRRPGHGTRRPSEYRFG